MNSTSTVGPPGEEEAVRPGSGPEGPGVPDAPDATDAGPRGSISKDELFHLLRNSRRRAVLQYLRGREGPVRMRDVAEQVAAWEHDTTVAGLASDERQRVYVALYQSHLDVLAEAGVIEYDKSRGMIEPRSLLEHVVAYADPPAPTDAGAVEGPGTAGAARATESGDDGDWNGDGGAPKAGLGRGEDGGDDGDERGSGGDAWARRYLAVSAAGSVLLVVTALDVAAFRTLSGTAAAGLLLLAFSALTAAKLVSDGGA